MKLGGWHIAPVEKKGLTIHRAADKIAPRLDGESTHDNRSD
jgi:hypothetical protein